MKLSVIIVVFNAFDLTKKCIKSIYDEKLKELEVIIIDNASNEKGFEEIPQKFPLTKTIRNKKNLGFSKAINQGLRFTSGEYILILNSDTEILPGTLSYLLEYMKKHKKVGLLSCRIFTPSHKLLQSTYKEFPNLLSHLLEYNYMFYKLLNLFLKEYHPIHFSFKDHLNEMTPKHIMGVFILTRRSTIADVGFFDERFFLYREETDFCKRLLLKNWKIRYLPNTGGVIHYGGESSKVKITQSSPYYLQSTYIFFKKYHSQIYVFLAWFLGATSSFTSWIFIYLMSFFKKREYFLLLNSWKKMAIWHFTDGFKIITKND